MCPPERLLVYTTPWISGIVVLCRLDHTGSVDVLLVFVRYSDNDREKVTVVVRSRVRAEVDLMRKLIF